MDLITELDKFLRASATNAELLDDELLEAISVPSPLQDALSEHLASGGSLVLSGTAGSGKTHLIRTLRQKVDLSRHVVCEDLASLSRELWAELGRFTNPTIVAANEGALIAAANYCPSATIYRRAVDLLHAMQIGQGIDEPSTFVLVDMAAADAASTETLDRILGLPILYDYASAYLQPAALEAWHLLREDAVRQRLVALVAAAAVASDSGGFTFRQLWQFVSELILPQADNSPWSYRVFHGRSKIARAIAETFPLNSIPMPETTARLWYRDLEALRAVMPVDAVNALWEYDDASRGLLFTFQRSLAVFCLTESPIDVLLRAPRDLWSKLHKDRSAEDLIRYINQYLTYGMRMAGVDLDLWVPTDLERRTTKPNVQVSLGTVSSSAFVITRNLIVAGLPAHLANQQEWTGTRLSLVHSPSRASLSLSRDLVSAITGVRSHRPSDRAIVEFDWRLFRFNNRAATCAATASLLQVIDLDFARRESSTYRLQLSDSRIVGDSA